MNDVSITTITKGVNRRYGGNSSILDYHLASSIVSDSKLISICDPSILKRMRRQKVDFLSLEADSNRTITSQQGTARQRFLRAMFDLSTRLDQRAASRRIRCSDVVVTAGHYDQLIYTLRASTGAKLVLNHAASPDLMADWLKSKPGLSSRAGLDYREVLELYDVVLFQAHVHAEEIRRRGYNVNCEVLLPTVNERLLLEAIASTSPYLGSQGFRICVVGTLQPRKNAIQAVEVASHLIDRGLDVGLHFIGQVVDEPYYERLQGSIIEKGLSARTFFYGHREDYAAFLAHSDVVLQTSTQEGVSRTLREAMFLGKLIAAFDIAGTRELLGRDSGLLSPASDAYGLASQITEVIRKPALRDKLTAEAQTRFRQHYSEVSYPCRVLDLNCRISSH